MSLFRPRRAGASWRLAVQAVGPFSTGGRPIHIGSHDQDGVRVLRHTEFDELVVGTWLRIEKQDTGVWLIDVAGVEVVAQADRNGRPTSVLVVGPDEDTADPGVAYDIDWPE